MAAERPQQGEHRTGAFAWLRLAVERPFASLPARIITSVFAAALVTSFAVAYTATEATEVFLRRKLDERFPQTLSRTAERLESWYQARELDIHTFARSGTVVDSLGPAAADDPLAREEARKYLAYVREGFPQYAALFVLEASGEVGVWVGQRLELAEPVLERLAQTSGAYDGRFLSAGSRRVQLISAPVEDRSGAVLGSLHAMVAAESLEELLQGDELDANTHVFLVSADGEVEVHSHGLDGRSYPLPIPEFTVGEPVAQDYFNQAGEHVVGSTMRLPRYGWGLVVEESYDAAFAPIVSVRRRITAINLGIVVAFGMLAFLIARSIVQPIHALSDSARRIAEGESDVELPALSGQDELGVLSRAFSEMVGKLHRKEADLVNANEELRRNNEVLEQLSFTDGLTRLHNHRYFQDRLRVETKRASRSDQPLALLLLDIDDFKALNDRYGHAVGDEVLRQVGTLLNDEVRETDLPARYGGEEFAVLAPHTNTRGAMALAEKLLAAIGDAVFEAEGVEDATGLRVTVSIGVAMYAGDPKRFFNDADRALYRAKENGKAQAVCA